MEWISSETPPKDDVIQDDDGTVLILLNGRLCRTGCYKYERWHYHVGVFMREVANGSYRVTHWMPLPRPVTDQVRQMEHYGEILPEKLQASTENMKWISAKTPPRDDEIQDDDGTVLVLLNGQWCRMGCYKYERWHYHVGIFMLEVDNGLYRVTHWMPLPKPFPMDSESTISEDSSDHAIAEEEER